MAMIDACVSTARCRFLLVALVVAVSIVNVLYLSINCPIDLSGDEAQYWDWSRRLDLSYYSKGPAVAYIIAASTSLFGDTMLAVRLPAIVMFAGITIGVYALASRVFDSERTALLAAGLMQLSPIFLFYSLAMTIDTPLVLCWTWATYFAVRAIIDGRRWAWIVVGVLLGLGFLAKYAALLWWVGMLAWGLIDRRRVRWGDALAGFAVSLAFTAPVLIWNARHDWVSFRHVAKQTGATGGSIFRGNFLELVGSQIGVVNPAIAILMIAAAGWAWKGGDSRRRMLLAIGATFFALTVIVSLFAKVQTNWPGPAYVTLIVLAAGFVADRAANAVSWRRWKGVVIAAVAIGIGAHVIGREPAMLIRPLRAIGLPEDKLAAIDGLSRLRGWEELGRRVGEEARALGDETIILCDSYMQTALMAFYVRGRPRTYYAGSYFTRPSRMTQYDLWDDCRLDRPELVGRNVVYVGKGGPMPDPLPAAFDRVEKLAEIPVYAGGVVVETFKVWRGWNFKGLARPTGPRSY